VADRSFRAYFEGESRQLPEFYKNIIQKDLGVWWQWLPQGALEHNTNAYLHKSARAPATKPMPGKASSAPPVL
jgi:hypothetical protein